MYTWSCGHVTEQDLDDTLTITRGSGRARYVYNLEHSPFPGNDTVSMGRSILDNPDLLSQPMSAL
jgi:hypothetical protein